MPIAGGAAKHLFEQRWLFGIQEPSLPPLQLAPVSRLISDTVVSAGEIGPEQIHKPDSVPPFSPVALVSPT